MSFPEVERALVALEARGAHAFDCEGCELVRMLIVRGAVLPPPADARVLQRARTHLARLHERFERALAQTTERLESAEQLHGPLAQDERAALERGEFRALRRVLRRLGQTRAAHRPSRRRVREQPQRREYEAALLDLNAQFTVARAVDDMPLHSGPYNPLRIATDLLARIGAVSPTYLTAQLIRLDELAVMLTLPEPPQPPRPTTPPKKPRGAVKRRSRAK